MFKAWKTQAENHIGDTIEYDEISHQVKMIILERTNVQLKGLSLTAHINDRCCGQRVSDAMKHN